MKNDLLLVCLSLIILAGCSTTGPVKDFSPAKVYSTELAGDSSTIVDSNFITTQVN